MTELLTTKQLAERLQCSERTIATWRKLGLPAIEIKVGRLVRFDPQAVERWLQSQQTKEQQEA